MSSMYTVSPASLHDHRDLPADRIQPSLLDDASPIVNQNHPITPADSSLLSPYSNQVKSNSASPANYTTPGESISTSTAYPPTDLSDFDDLFCGTDFDSPCDGTPAFLNNHLLGSGGAEQPESTFQGLEHTEQTLNTQSASQETFVQSYASGDTTRKDQSSELASQQLGTVPAEQFLDGSQLGSVPFGSNPPAPEPSLDTKGITLSGGEGPGLTTPSMAGRSPRITVSHWTRNWQEHAPSSTSLTTGSETAQVDYAYGDILSPTPRDQPLQDEGRSRQDSQVPPAAADRRGLGPDERNADETVNINELAKHENLRKTNLEVAAWRNGIMNPRSPTPAHVNEPARQHGIDDVSLQEIPFGEITENRYLPGQTYFQADLQGGPLTKDDIELMRQPQQWADGPRFHPILSDRRQPETAQAAISMFEAMCRDTDSMVSRVATWGTRRRNSDPSVTEESLSGNFLKKLSLRGDGSSRRPSLRQAVGHLARSVSSGQFRKRKGSSADEAASHESGHGERRESRDTLALPSHETSWAKRKSMPSLNTALVGMASGAAAIGSVQAHSPISATSTSPKHRLSVSNPFGRARSRSETTADPTSTPNILGLWEKQGGPPVAQLAKTPAGAAQGKEEDEENEENVDERDGAGEPSETHVIVPTLEGFREHILELNPYLAHRHHYLVERIAGQMVARLKQLQNQKIKHLRAVASKTCPNLPLCIAQGGHSTILKEKGDSERLEPTTVRAGSIDNNNISAESAITAENLPKGIPIPPTSALPAELECQLCFTAKKLQKPSDWTKHVHEDVAPFTCTWEGCNESKMFKRKADWVRHENEGHRHLESWTCDYEDCRHTCYRRDNFLQHLVREHKFTEPTVKNKTAIKKSNCADPTWQRVDHCHHYSPKKPQDEACRFCGKTFVAWKKLTVHLAKHMELISLPVLTLIDTKDLNPDTVISPVQEPPSRNLTIRPPASKSESQTIPQRAHAYSNPNPIGFDNPQTNFGYGNVVRTQMQPPFYGQQQASPLESFPPRAASGLMMPPVNMPFTLQQQQQQQPPHAMSVSAGNTPFMSSTASYMPMQGQMESFPAFDTSPLGLQDSAGGQPFYNSNNNYDLTTSDVEPFNEPDNVSPYSRSPNTNQGGGGYW